MVSMLLMNEHTSGRKEVQRQNSERNLISLPFLIYTMHPPSSTFQGSFLQFSFGSKRCLGSKIKTLYCFCLHSQMVLPQITENSLSNKVEGKRKGAVEGIANASKHTTLLKHALLENISRLSRRAFEEALV